MKEKKEKKGVIVNVDELEGDTFIGQITDVKFGKNNPNAPDKDYITLVLNVDFLEKPFELFIPYSERKQSVWGFFLSALKSCDVAISDISDLKGATFKWERKDIVLRGGFVAKEGFPLPIEHIVENK